MAGGLVAAVAGVGPPDAPAAMATQTTTAIVASTQALRILRICCLLRKWDESLDLTLVDLLKLRGLRQPFLFTV
ncbi:MAG: hypothetical protein M3022_15340 [Actinomycetota bacterium]|nr:hypothetical protein [Actinomycetota bacterium]